VFWEISEIGKANFTGKIEGNVFERNSLGSDEAEEEGCEASLS